MKNIATSEIINEHESDSKNNEQKEQARNLHEGHRERMKERFLSTGTDSMQPHELLELLLFLAIPRGNTNEIGHELIERFGSFAQVLDAPYHELLKVKGISHHSASTIKCIPGLAEAYAMSKQADSRVFSNPETIGNYFVSRFLSATVEMVYLLLLDSSLQYIACELIAKGSVASSTVQIRTIVDLVVRYNACAVVLAHNHPRGLVTPSPADITATYKVCAAMKVLEIRFVDHIIVAQNDYCALIGDGRISLDV